MKSYGVTIPMKPSLAVQSYTVVLFISYVVLTFESLDENLLCYHSTETSFVDLLHSTICFLGFYKIKTYYFFLASFYFGHFYDWKGFKSVWNEVEIFRKLKTDVHLPTQSHNQKEFYMAAWRSTTTTLHYNF